MTTLADVKESVLRLLQDPVKTEDDDGIALTVVRGNQTSSELLVDAVQAALSRISARVWKQSIYETSETEDASVFDLPSDLIKVEAVFDNNLGTFIPKLALQATGQIAITSGNAWLQYPEGKITFINAIPAADGAKIYYSAHWALPTDDADVLDSPAIADTAVALYATSYCLMGEASGTARLRQFSQRVDAGTPLDIPAESMSTFFIKRFELELNSLPMTEGAIL